MPPRRRAAQAASPAPLVNLLPTALTCLRIFACPALVKLHYDARPSAVFFLFCAASATDWLDGYLARRLNAASRFGAFLDPVADKLVVATTLIVLAAHPPEILAAAGLGRWTVVVPTVATILREIAMSGLREYAAIAGASGATKVSGLGKLKTAAQMASIVLLLASEPEMAGRLGTGAQATAAWGVGLLWLSAALAWLSAAGYGRAVHSKLG